MTRGKSPSGIAGLDRMTGGGLPRGRATLVSGGPGCGKTIFGLEYLVHGAEDHGERGVLVTFEETLEDLLLDTAGMHLDLEGALDRGDVAHRFIQTDRDLEASGSFDLDPLGLRIATAMDEVGATRVVLDSIDALFGLIADHRTLRLELRRLLSQLTGAGATVVITGERDGEALTRYGFESFVTDCVILLEHVIEGTAATRRLRVVKYRGSKHETDATPFLIDERGIWVEPITAAGLDHEVSPERVPSGVPALDELIGGGYYAGSTVMLSGNAGTGKTSLAASFAAATAARGERALYLSFEESPAQLRRNLGSIGIDLDHDQLIIDSARPARFGLEMHLARITRLLEEHAPSAVVLDPITSFEGAADLDHQQALLTRIVDALKARGITGVLTSLVAGDRPDTDRHVAGVSSIVDTWIHVRNVEHDAERNRALYVLKSRGMAHSNQVREFRMTDRGIELVPIAVGPDGVLTGAAREAHQEAERRRSELLRAELDRHREAIRQREAVAEARIAAIQAELAMERSRLELQIERLADEDAESDRTRERKERRRRRVDGGES